MFEYDFDRILISELTIKVMTIQSFVLVKQLLQRCDVPHALVKTIATVKLDRCIVIKFLVTHLYMYFCVS